MKNSPAGWETDLPVFLDIRRLGNRCSEKSVQKIVVQKIVVQEIDVQEIDVQGMEAARALLFKRGDVTCLMYCCDLKSKQAVRLDGLGLTAANSSPYIMRTVFLYFWRNKACYFAAV